MKKKCRVYKPQSMEHGGQPPMTQDSQPGSIPQEKSNNFLRWIKENSELAQLDQELYNMKCGGEYKSKMQYGGSPNGYGKLEQTNTQAFEQAYENMMYDPMQDIQTLASNTVNGFGNLFKKEQEPWKKAGMSSDDYYNKYYGKAQKGIQVVNEVNYPDYGMGFMPEIDNSDYLPNGGLDFIPETDDKIPSNYQLWKDNLALVKEGNKTENQNNLVKQDTQSPYGDEKQKSRNPYAFPQTILAGARLLTGIGEMDERAALEEQINRKFGNVHENYGTMGAERGDYMVNLPGVGDPLKPNQHTRMGYNTKIAQDGLQIDEEMNLTEEQINELIAQGYNLEYLD